MIYSLDYQEAKFCLDAFAYRVAIGEEVLKEILKSLRALSQTES